MSFFFGKTGDRASTMSRDETKPCRLWSMTTKTCLVLTVKDSKVKSVTCKGVPDDRDEPGESSRLQLFMLMISFLSLVVWQPYIIIKFKIFDLCILIDLVFRVTHCFINSIGLLQQTITWYKIRHAGGQAHYYSRTGTF